MKDIPITGPAEKMPALQGLAPQVTVEHLPKEKETLMITSLILATQFFIGIGKRLASDAYYRSLGVLILIVLLIGTLFAWLVGKFSLVSALLYAVTTMSMNTYYNSMHVQAAGNEMAFFHMVYTFLSVGIFIIFTIETGKTMIATYEEIMKKIADRKVKKAAAKHVAV